MGTLWVKLRGAPRLSWHLLAGDHTRCGRSIVVPSPTTTDLPMGERSCESCLRLVERDRERVAG